MSSQIFISYSKKDKEFAWKLADDLLKAGHKVWIDRSLVVGEDWEQTIEQNLADAEEVIVVLSAHAIASKWVQHEGSIVYGLKKKMFPVLIEEIPPEDLPIWASKFQYHSFIASDYPAALRGLVAALRPPNPIRDLLDRKKIEYNAYQSLMQVKELELVAADLENSTLELDEVDRRLLLYSAAALERGRLWLELAGQGGRQWLREALTQPDIPSAVRSGAAACLGDVSDSPTYDQLCQAGLSPQGGNSRQEALDLLALFLHHSPKKFEVPGPLRKEVFLRLARLQRQAGAWERRHRVRVARAAALAGVVALFGIDMLWGDFLSMLVGTGAIFGVLSFLAFVLAGQMLAFIFAEVMTSLEWILQRSAAIVKILALGAAGIAAGAPLLWVMAGTGRTWYAGGLLGLALGLQNAYPALKAPTLNWVTSVVSGLAVVGIASLALQPMEAASLGSVLTTAGFVLFYLLARPGRASQQE